MWKNCISVVHCTNIQRKGVNKQRNNTYLMFKNTTESKGLKEKTINFLLFSGTTNNNNNNRLLYSAFPNYDQSASQCIITPVIGFRHNSALKVHFLHSLGSIPASRRFIGAHVPTQPQFRSHPTGSPFNTWVESSNVDKVSCWRTKVPSESGNRTRRLRNHQRIKKSENNS